VDLSVISLVYKRKNKYTVLHFHIDTDNVMPIHQISNHKLLMMLSW